MDYKTLETLYQDGKAKIDVDRINHREFLYNGMRYFCGWSSERAKGTQSVQGFTVTTGAGAPGVVGWIVYKAEPNQTVSPATTGEPTKE